MNESLFNVHEAGLLITVVEAVFLALGILFLPRSRLQSHWLLGSLLLLIAIILGSTLLVWNPYLQNTALADSQLVVALLAFGLLAQGPMLYLYMASFSHRLKLHHWRFYIHFFPALIAVAAIFAFNIRVFDWLPWNWSAISPIKHQVVLITWAAFKCFPLFYALLCWLAEIRLRRQLKHRYASLPFWELRWAELILGGFTLHWMWAFSAYWLSGYVSDSVNDWMGIISNYVTVILINGLFIFAMYSGRKALILPDIPDPSRDSQNIDAEQEKVAIIDAAIRIQALHLDSHINLERFAEHCNIKPRELSTLINSHYQKNFFEFINYHRIQEVKKRLNEDDSSTILDIALESGFNSQSAFQRFFKRFEGITPSQYRHSRDALATPLPEPTKSQVV